MLYNSTTLMINCAMARTKFHPAVAAWFQASFPRPTSCQQAAWPAIGKGRHTLIAAPTGSGKTLAAFLCAIDDLLSQGLEQGGYLEQGIQVLYVSPLKALSNDVQKNLQGPLQGIRDQLMSAGLPDVDIQAMVRTGDTPQRDRERMRRNPPHILVTTPESLYLLLTSESGRSSLRTVRTVIVDEIHALAGNKRGAHLSLSLQRLCALAETVPTRIGLSATQKPIHEMANFLIGNETEQREIVDVGHARQRDLALTLPGSPLEAVLPTEAWSEIYEQLAHYIEQHRTTLIFVNTRRLAERISRHLAERLGEQAVTAHHGSLAREHRLNAEQKLKLGELRALVATASLELGIDIGDVDLVCQIGSPRSIAAFLQRAGRSGHAVNAVPKGRLFPTSRDELIECAALLDAIARGELENLNVSDRPVDVLAQQIIAEVAGREWSMQDLYRLYTQAWPYRTMSREQFDEVVDMLANGFSTRRGRRGAYLHRDAVGQRLRARRSARLVALTNAGTIPDQFDYDVVMEPEGQFVGTLNEDFAFESLPGDIFQLGNTSYRILRVERSTVRVEDARGQPPNIPFWFGEAPGRSDELSFAVSRFRSEFSRHWEEDRSSVDEWLNALMLAPAARAQIIDYLGPAHCALGLLPTQNTIVFERFFDESGDTHLVIHSPFGSRINRAWGLALRKRFCRRFNFELQAAALEDTIVLSLSATHSFPLDEVRGYLKPDTVRHILIQALLDTPLFATRWRWAATTALALQRNRNGKRVPPQLQRMNAEDLVAVVFPDQLACFENIAGEREVPEHPLVDQTIADCLYEAMDVEGLEVVIRGIESGAIDVVTRELALPSPLAQEILTAKPYAFLDDAPAEERRTSAVQARGFLDVETAAQLGKLDPDAIARVRDEAWPRPRDPDELHDALLTLGGVRESEGIRGRWGSFFEQLIRDKRATILSPDGSHRLWVAAERLQQWLMVHPKAECSPMIPAVSVRGFECADREQALLELVRSRMEGAGPISVEELVILLGCEKSEIDHALTGLETEGFVMRGDFTGARNEWCERRLLARINRYTVKRLRMEIEPVSAADYMRFLVNWQGLSAAERRQGDLALVDVMQQLEGYFAPVKAWVTGILPARLSGFESAMLDSVCMSGRYRWLTAGNTSERPGIRNSTSITFVARRNMTIWQRRGTDVQELSGFARDVHHVLQQDGALFFDEILSVGGLDEAEVLNGLKQLVARGIAGCDGFHGLRYLIEVENGAMPESGRWSLNRRAATDNEQKTEGVAKGLLRRYGVVFRKLLEREAAVIPTWRELLIAFRRLEARGEIRGGRFVAGFSGEQFAIPEAVAQLRSARRADASGEMIAIEASDPLNLVGTIIPGDRIPLSSRQRILLRDGLPIATQSEREVRFIAELDSGEQWQARNALVQPLPGLSNRTH